MQDILNWTTVWQELLDNLSRQPRCPEHSEYPYVKTLYKRWINDIVEVRKDGILVRSHESDNEDFIKSSIFKAWWNHLITNKTASLKPDHPNNPHSDRSRIVGAIMATCLSDKIRVVNHNTIELIQ